MPTTTICADHESTSQPFDTARGFLPVLWTAGPFDHITAVAWDQTPVGPSNVPCENPF